MMAIPFASFLGGGVHSTANLSPSGTHGTSYTMPNMTPVLSAPETANQHRKSTSPRNIVLCFDGTGNAYEDNTNVVKMMAVLERETDNQIVYYQAGLGTYGPPGLYNKAALQVAALFDLAFATHIDLHVMDAYQYLMNRWQEGDRIFLFGFSRGAYTARALAGMLEKVGLLGSGNEEQVAFAYKIYKANDNLDKAAGFKYTFCRHVKVHFVGVWDTVQSVGLLYGRSLPFAFGSDHIGFFRHALSIDERRARFKPELWREDPDLDNRVRKVIDNQNEIVIQKAYKTREIRPVTDILEVWFAGNHGDVGGGWPDSDLPGRDRTNASNIPLRWMIKEAVEQGLLLKPPPKRGDGGEMHLDPTILPLDPSKQKYPDPAVILSAYNPPSKSRGMRLDASRSPDLGAEIHDSLRSWKPKVLGWWIIELLPISITRYLPDGQRKVKLAWNLGRPRDIPEGAIFHSSVKLRMAKGYKPAAQLPRQAHFVD